MILWFKFDNPNIGKISRSKHQKQIRQDKNIKKNFVPIKSRICIYKFNDNIKFKRKQFPISPARAMTIHKSQGGTFEEIVYEYEPNQPRQLVYVALSRVTNISGLHITTPKNIKLNFKHGNSVDSSTHVKELKQEFNRLSKHQLSTFRHIADHFITKHKTLSSSILLTNFTIDKFKDCCKEIEQDYYIMQSDILILTGEDIRNDKDLICLDSFQDISDLTRTSNFSKCLTVLI